MGIEVTFQRLSPEVFCRVTANESVWEDFRRSDLLGFTQEEFIKMAARPSPEGTAKLMAAFEKRNQDKTLLDISKDWHVLYYLLTGSSEIAEGHREGQPLHNVIFGGHPTSVKAGYGSVRYFDHPLISEIITALESVGKDQLSERFVPEEMRRLQIYAAPHDERERDIILNLFEYVRAFFREAAQANEYVIVYGH